MSSTDVPQTTPSPACGGAPPPLRISSARSPPHSPDPTRSLAARAAGLNRWVHPAARTTPFLEARSSSSRPRAGPHPTGTSTRTCFPASSSRAAIPARSGGGAHTTAASNPPAASRPSTDPCRSAWDPPAGPSPRGSAPQTAHRTPIRERISARRAPPPPDPTCATLTGTPP